MSKLEMANRILQIFFIRLTRHSERRILDGNVTEASVLSDGSIGVGMTITQSKIFEWYSIMYWVVPFTGWSTAFEYEGNRKHLYITPQKEMGKPWPWRKMFDVVKHRGTVYLIPALSYHPFIRAVSIHWWRHCWQFSITGFSAHN
jgi:hypothetical protein